MQTRKRIVDSEISSNEQIATNHFVIRLKAPILAGHILPGQFVSVKVQPGTTDPLLRIPLSLYRVDPEGISLLYKVVGQATTLLSQKKAGEVLSLLGPLGNGFDLSVFDQHEDYEAVLIGGGCGMAPLYLLAAFLVEKGVRVTVLIGAREREQVLCEREFVSIGAKVLVATEDGSQKFKGYVTDLCKQHLEHVEKPSKVVVYGSGPNLMLRKLAAITRQMDIPSQFSLEAYMACGIGACYGCSVLTNEGYKLCCKDGPVFNGLQLV
jgi:dihydroorotate dehydrogenase electron transfer subunit